MVRLDDDLTIIENLYNKQVNVGLNNSQNIFGSPTVTGRLIAAYDDYVFVETLAEKLACIKTEFVVGIWEL